ncbi:MAG: molybdopterin molybdotransferase MoeA [Bacteroidales bacterium]
MTGFEEALKIISSEAFTLDTEILPLNDSVNRVLAQDVFSDIDMPPFNKSAMDGYACRRNDLDNRLKVIDTVRAGDIPGKTVGINQCVKIMTGGKVPEGADCVVMVEHTVQEGEGYIRFTKQKTAVNIAFKGEDMENGNLVLSKGRLIGPQHIAMLASAGCSMPGVYRQPRVAVMTTGDEIVEPEIKPEGTCIRNSNGPQLIAQTRRTGALPDYLGIVRDTPEITDTAVKSAMRGNDLILITGGVSMGDYDFVPSVLKDNGFRLFFEKVAVKPGKPTVFGRRDNIFVFGLPGNPVSSFTIFELMVRPLIYGLMGHEYKPAEIRLPIGVDYSRRKADRVSWTPVHLNSAGEIIPAGYHGSAHIHSLADAWGLMGMATGVYSYKKGDLVNVRQI